ncbi:2-octaprenyl-6-methoxyphenyl hydroxylase [Erwinia oleae]|uniref:2-octaprenyl-6-methoxyphenyl hydroxylase n=1 Tax=Erwinia oleae TaxID=796334 RepID=UPI000551C563|nr:2-octaprenyl-6-methoxyphenyl hydroxylase [Erwinia oleae]
MSIIIAGGGMAGATLALAISHLTQGQLAVTLVEASEPETRTHPGYDGRAIALAEGTCRQLAAINLWPALKLCATAITHVHVSDRGHAGFVSLNAADYHIPALGQVVELHDIGQRLYALLKKAPGVRLCCPAKVATVDRQQASVSVTLDTGETLEGRLLVAADGSHSDVARACGVQWQKNDYQQVAVIANVSSQQPHRGRAWERFTEHGPLALLPMSAGRSSLVWCHPLADKAQVDGWSDTHFLSELQRAFGWRLGRFTQVGQRQSYPLQLQAAAHHVSHRLALVGNAAQTLHPIAGQGFNLGLRDVMTLAETLAAAWRAGQDAGSFTVLHQYQQRRQPDAETTIGITDTLVRIFANRYTPLVAGRNLGLLAMDSIPLVRNLLAERTLGWVER